MPGLAIADLASWLVSPAGSPVTAVGEAIIGLLPAPLINFGKDTLGTADKPILLGIVTVVVLAVAGLAGQLELRRGRMGGAVFAALAVLGLVGVAMQPDATAASFLPTVVGLLLGYMLLSTMIGRLVRWQPRRGLTDASDVDRRAQGPARRSFLALLIGVGAASVVAGIAGRTLAAAASATSTARSLVSLPLAATKAPAVPAGVDLGIAGLDPYVTPNADFYRIDTALQVPVDRPRRRGPSRSSAWSRTRWRSASPTCSPSRWSSTWPP